MKKILVGLLAISLYQCAPAAVTFGQWDGTNVIAFTTKGYVDAADTLLDQKIDALTPTGIVTSVAVNGEEDGGEDNKLFIHDIDFYFEADKLGSDEETPNGI